MNPSFLHRAITLRGKIGRDNRDSSGNHVVRYLHQISGILRIWSNELSVLLGGSHPGLVGLSNSYPVATGILGGIKRHIRLPERFGQVVAG
jgi:hypothetical protein